MQFGRAVRGVDPRAARHPTQAGEIVEAAAASTTDRTPLDLDEYARSAPIDSVRHVLTWHASRAVDRPAAKEQDHAVSTMEPANDAHIELQQKIEQHRSFGARYGPGTYFYWFMAHHFAAADVLFADLRNDADRTTYNERCGRVFLVTSTALVIADYENAAEDSDGDPQQNFGTVNVQFHSREPSTTSLTWTGRSLRVPKNQYGSTPRGVRLPAGALTLQSGGLSISLPGEDADDGDDYVERLRSAIGL